MKFLAATLFCAAFNSLHGVAQPLFEPGKQHRLTQSAVCRPGTYRLSSLGLEQPVLEITGSNIVIDFKNAVLTGTRQPQQPDSFAGLAIYIHDGSNITIRNLKAAGYKVALLARRVTKLTIAGCDFSYNYRPRLNSSPEKEDISDWMSYHHNENDEWLRYGAAMYLDSCDNAIISRNTVTGGQNALMMTACNNAAINRNNFSFNSGIGLGMYRCNNNRVMNNRLDFNVRGYSHGVYNRGQDSAGILVYEQSSNNVFAYNSATHSGDGFFLWAGQTTMDSGTGGCNGNLLYKNNFSYAPTNGIEVTFSSNTIKENIMHECDYGIWGGYSYNTSITGNQFENNRIAVAIEHGRYNYFLNNSYTGDKTGIRLWARRTQPADWGYAKRIDTRSRDYLFAAEQFTNVKQPFDIVMTDSISFCTLHDSLHTRLKFDSTVTNTTTGACDVAAPPGYFERFAAIDREHKTYGPLPRAAERRGRKEIRITPWGPYDFRYPVIWHTNPGRAMATDTLYFELLGPPGQWRVVTQRGFKTVSAAGGRFPARIYAVRNNRFDWSRLTDLALELEYTGPAYINTFGETVKGNKPQPFAFRKYFLPVHYTIDWFAFDSTQNPVKDYNHMAAITAKEHIMTAQAFTLNYAWWNGKLATELEAPQFVTIAKGSFETESGNYELSVTWDDAVKVFVDDKLVLDEWNPSEYTFDESPNRKLVLPFSAGKHLIRVEHAELGGFATLAIKWRKL